MKLFGNLFTPTGTLPVLRREIGGRPVSGVPSATDDKPSDGKAPVIGGAYGERIVHARNPETALTVSAVYRATELRAKTIGVMPVQYQKKDVAGGNYLVDMLGLGKRLNYLMQEEPNPMMSASSLWELVTINRLMYGNGFVYIERDIFGDPIHLWLVINGGYNLIDGTYIITYLTDYGYVEKVGVPRQNILHFPNTFRYMNGFWGMSTLQFAAETLSLIKTESQQALETAAKGGRMKLIIGEEKPESGQGGTLAWGMFNKEQMNKYARELQDQMYRGQDILAIRGIDKVQNISMSAQDMQLLEQMNLGLDGVARYWGCPRPLLMLDTNSHYNDYKNATMEFHTRTILPDKTDMEHEIFRKLIGTKGYGMRRIHICEKPLMAMDPEMQAKVDQLNLQTGAKTVNEIRAEHDMPAVENGDEPMASANLLTLKALLAKSAPAPGRPTTDPNTPQS